MTLPIERSRSRRPITWLTLTGVLLLPVIIGGILIAALYNPTERLDNLTAAIVNEDEPVDLDGQMVPLGRQLTAGLVEGSDDLDSNLSWTLSNPDDAEEGLADGTYAAVITIPENFSSAALSTRPGETPEQATIEVTTPPDSLIVDDAITGQIASAAASIMGTELSSTYLENVLLGFTTLGDQLGEAADGATQLADGADTAADGTVSLADGIDQLSGGASQLGSGASELAGGAGGIASGADQLASGTSAAATGLDTWAAGAGDIATGTQGLADGIGQVADQVSALPDVPAEAVDAVNDLAANSEAITASVTDAAAQLTALADSCVADGGTAELCDSITSIADQTNAALPAVTDVLAGSDQIASTVTGLAGFESQLVAGLGQLQTGAEGLAGGMGELASGASDAAGGLDQLASGMSDLSDGAGAWASGAQTWATGANTWATGATAAAVGAGDLADGVGQLADGTGDLADGLTTATEEIPSYTDAEADALATVVADPVSAEGTGSELFGASAVPLLAMLALWFGGLGSFIALQAVSRRALTSRTPSAALALRGLAPAAAIGAAQGFLVSAVVQLAASYEWGEWLAFTGIAMLAGVAFAAVNQALVAAFGGAGRWISAIIGVIAVATGIVSTVPGALSEIAGLLPTAPAYHGMIAALTAAGGGGAAIAGLIIWTLIGFGVTVLVVSRRRSVSARSLLEPAPAMA